MIHTVVDNYNYFNLDIDKYWIKYIYNILEHIESVYHVSSIRRVLDYKADSLGVKSRLRPDKTY